MTNAKKIDAIEYCALLAGAIGMGLLCLTGPGCAALGSVTPADRAAAYEREAQAARVACKAYAFDRAAGLVEDVPSMTEVCK